MVIRIMENQRFTGINSINISTWEKVADYLRGCNLPASTVSAALSAGISPDAMSKGQLCSKFWLRDVALAYSMFNDRHICICGGWYGILSAIILNEFDVITTTSIDIDPLCQDIAYQLVDKENFYAITQDMHEHSYSPYDVVINTSFEHVEPEKWLSALGEYKGKVIVQSNNFFEGEGHINCVSSVEELAKQINFNKIIYKGTLELPMYERYMIVGEIK